MEEKRAASFLLAALAAVLCLLASAWTLSAQQADPEILGGPFTVPGPINWCSPETGSGNSYVCLDSSVAQRQLHQLNPGIQVHFLSTHTNTGAATVSVDGISKTIKSGKADR